MTYSILLCGDAQRNSPFMYDVIFIVNLHFCYKQLPLAMLLGLCIQWLRILSLLRTFGNRLVPKFGKCTIRYKTFKSVNTFLAFFAPCVVCYQEWHSTRAWSINDIELISGPRADLGHIWLPFSDWSFMCLWVPVNLLLLHCCHWRRPLLVELVEMFDK